MKIYTKGGDKGRTSLIGGERVSKGDLRVEAYGTVDELSAFIAMLRDNMDGYVGETSGQPALQEERADLQRILGELMSVEASLAGGALMPEGAEKWLEERIDALSKDLPPIERFTLPGGHKLVSLAHVCRTVCRRAERCAVRAGQTSPYLNRLSDYLYTLTRTLTLRLGVEEIYF